ncbi:EVE domain-containing protein [Methyloligella sp. 2.7D]|uniref:EVE domain-containing protein n=1 Tax=unclassified Methyloligella TaxID=2625955 RepID=UPI00157D0CDA|nr:EVE domain-containing protein [Methyloligella sp. GL2]QKP76186.1 EVE domain-containing protein [Methyloligella sp. GL2]
MAYWLFKSEPHDWSWDQQKAKGEAGEEWDHVRNYQARNNMRQMKIGELGFFYHSVGPREVVGIVKVVAEAHPDSTDDTGKWECVDVAAVEDMPKPVTLDDVKAEPKLQDMVLVNNSRLSVQPVTLQEWDIICRMGGLKKPPRP